MRQAQLRYGVKPLTGEQVRYGLENLNIDAKRIEALGLTGVMRPLATNCRDHEGARVARIHQWDGKQWNYTSDWYEADMQIIRPLIRDTADALCGGKENHAPQLRSGDERSGRRRRKATPTAAKK